MTKQIVLVGGAGILAGLFVMLTHRGGITTRGRDDDGSVSDRERVGLSIRDQFTDQNAPSSTSTSIPNVTATEPLTVRFTETARSVGISFEYYGSPTPEHFMTEQNGGGIAVFDYDQDGLCDVFFSNGSDFRRPAASVGAVSQLFRAIDLWKFTPVGSDVGVSRSEQGQGCCAGDFNNDGFPDLAIACYGGNRLLRNNGDGTFSNVGESAITESSAWSTSIAFADLDADGCLDLYVVNYVDWTSQDPPCFLDRERSVRKVCSPLDFNGQPDDIFRNMCDGRFEVAGTFIGPDLDTEGKGLALLIADLDDDRRLDVFVANDTTRNFLFLNRGELQFEEVAVARGLGMSEDGTLGSSMGIACGDYNRDGKPDLFVTNFAHEVVDALTNLGQSGFMASNAELGIDRASRATLNFGIVLDDFDLDGWPDLFYANGHIWDSGPGSDEYEMRPTLMQNQGGTKFVDISATAGPYFERRWLGRAVASGDLDNDGDTDLVVGHLDAPAAVLRNDSVRRGKSLRLQFIGTRSSRDPLGCRVEAELTGGSSWVTQVPSGASFQASHSPVVIVPTGTEGDVSAVTMHWSSGASETWFAPQDAGTVRENTLVFVEGTGQRQ